MRAAWRAAWRPLWQGILGVAAGPVLAWQFLTAVPLPLSMPAEPRHLGRAVACFPLIGALIGLLLALVDAGVRRLLPVGPASAVVLVASVLLTGGLHLDGLMDTADGVFGGRTVERRLEIMRDSRAGSYGVLAGALALLLKFACLADLPAALRLPALVIAPVVGRWAMAGAVVCFLYARPQGLGAAFKAGARPAHAGAATALALVAAWMAFGVTGIWLLLGGGLVALLAAGYLAGKLGGLTGDCYGAVNETVEVGLLLGFAAAVPFWAPLPA